MTISYISYLILLSNIGYLDLLQMFYQIIVRIAENHTLITLIHVALNLLR